MHALKISNDVLMFVIELAAFAAYGVRGWHVAGLLVVTGHPVWGGVLAALALVVVGLDRTVLAGATAPWGPAG